MVQKKKKKNKKNKTVRVECSSAFLFVSDLTSFPSRVRYINLEYYCRKIEKNHRRLEGTNEKKKVQISINIEQQRTLNNKFRNGKRKMNEREKKKTDQHRLLKIQC